MPRSSPSSAVRSISSWRSSTSSSSAAPINARNASELGAHRLDIEGAQPRVLRHQAGSARGRRIEVILEVQVGPAEIVDGGHQRVTDTSEWSPSVALPSRPSTTTASPSIAPSRRTRRSRAVAPDDRVRQAAVGDTRALLDRHVGADHAPLDGDAVLDVHRIVNRDPGEVLPARGPVLQQDRVGLEKRIELATVVPPADFGGENPLAVLDHPLEGVGQEVLALILGRAEDVVDALPETVHRANIVEPDVGELRDGGLGLLDDRVM